MDAIVRNAHVQVQLIDDLLDLSRITSGKMRLDVHGRSSWTRCCRERSTPCVPPPTPRASGSRPTIDPDAGAGDGRPRPAAADRLEPAHQRREVHAARRARSSSALHRVTAHVQIVVSDTGQGIAPEVLPHVFERFRQADSSSTRAHGGLGLGLALVKHLVELHGGTVAADSAGRGQGATFVVTLPASSAAAFRPRRVPAHAAGRDVDRDRSPDRAARRRARAGG